MSKNPFEEAYHSSDDDEDDEDEDEQLPVNGKDMPLFNAGHTGDLDELSFYRSNSHEIRAYAQSLLNNQPIAPAPAAPPPPPPSSSSSTPTPSPHSSMKKTVGKAVQPVIVSYEENSYQNNVNSPRNDDNPYHFDFGSQNNNELPGLVAKMRMANIALAISSFLFEIPLIVFKVFTPAKMALAGYLGFMALLLLGFELHTPIIRNFLMDNFGILYSPIGRSLYMILMGMLAYGQDTILNMMLGVLLGANGVFTMVVNCIYKDFKRIHEHPDHRDDMLEKAKVYGVQNNWVSVEDAEYMEGEITSLLTNTPAHPYQTLYDDNGNNHQ